MVGSGTFGGGAAFALEAVGHRSRRGCFVTFNAAEFHMDSLQCV